MFDFDATGISLTVSGPENFALHISSDIPVMRSKVALSRHQATLLLGMLHTALHETNGGAPEQCYLAAIVPSLFGQSDG